MESDVTASLRGISLMRRLFSLENFASTPTLPAGYSIELATVSMASKLVDLRNQIAKETDFVNASTLERERNNIVNLSGEVGRYFVALFNNTPVGVCLCYFDDTTGENLVHISLVAVLKKHSGKGVATSLIGKAKEFAIEKNCEFLRLHVDGDNPTAKRLYEKLSFEVTEKRTYYEMKMDL